MTTAVEIRGVSKRFRLYHEKYTSLKERVLHAGHVPYDEFWALKDVTADIASGQTIGILGRNGSGKSTLLKCLAGILQPTAGDVVVHGQLAAMLELGAGFQPELSGRDNVYLNASLLGFSRREIDRRFDEIVEFAELGQFIDNQVKYYSSGMYVRLGFAVAVSVEPDVLLVDEVLAVGDERFQRKCLDRVQRFQREGRTIIVVSHSPDLMRQICDTIMVLDRGELVTVAKPGEAIRAFRDRLVDSGFEAPTTAVETLTDGVSSSVFAQRPRSVRLGEVTLDHPGAEDRNYLVTGEPLEVRVELEVREPVQGASFTISLISETQEVLFASDAGTSRAGLRLDAGTRGVSFRFAEVPLLDGRFALSLDVRDAGGAVLDQQEQVAHFEVMNPGRATGVVALPLVIEVLDDATLGLRAARGPAGLAGSGS